jgi:hypothetical protein
MLRLALSGWRSIGGCVATGALSVTLAACGGGSRQDAHEPSGNFPVAVQQASFPVHQSLAQQAHLVIKVRNADSRHTIPDIAVTITDDDYGTSAQAFAYRLSSPSLPELAYPSRPVWIIDRGPETTAGKCAYSCQQGGPGGGVTGYANTWALGPLAPGHTATFDWAVTAVHSGTHVVHYRVAAGLNGKAKAVLSGGGTPEGSFQVTIAGTPEQSYVNDSGQVVNAPAR